MLDFNLKQLEVFAAVAEYSSFTNAAEALYLSQSTVSAHIKNLEDTLNVTLFQRDSHRKIELTEEGRRVYGTVKEILDRCKMLQSGAKQENAAPLLTVAASSVPAQYLLPGLLAEFSRENPNFRYLLRRGDSLKVHEMLLSGEVQLGFAGLKMDEEQFSYCPVLRDHLVLITENSQRFRAAAPDSGDSLFLQEPVVLREEDSGTWQMTAAWLRSKEILPESLHLVARMETPEAICRAVAQGMGVSVMSSLAAEEDVAAGKLLQFELGTEYLWRQIYAVQLKNGPKRSSAVRKFDSFLEKWMEKMKSGGGDRKR